jgi:RNA polymerase sigma-70 factor (sigma-E family)
MTTGPTGTGNSREDELLSQLYQQLTELQAARFGAGYDLAAGVDRFGTWLREHAMQDQARRGSHGEIPGAWADWDADLVVTALYDQHYASLVRQAAFLVRDMATAEEVVQDSFVAVHSAWPKLSDSDHALSYLRQSVVNRSRSALRHRVGSGRNSPEPAPDKPEAKQQPKAAPGDSPVISALGALPARQREVLVMRYYANFSETQIAEIMGISEEAVKRHAARARASLRAVLQTEE